MVTLDQIRYLIGEILELGDRTETLTTDTPLLGNLPELDSMAVVAVITELEQRFDIVVDDDDRGAETFETLGSLLDFVVRKQAG
jgi:acyl carrier protein